MSSLEVKSGLQLHLDAQTLEESDGEKVLKQWGDSSGNGLKAISTGAPKLIPDAINGRAAVRLDGKNDSSSARNLGEGIWGPISLWSLCCSFTT